MSVIRQPVAFLMGVPVRILKGAVNVLASPIVAISTLALSQFCGKGSDENKRPSALALRIAVIGIPGKEDVRKEEGRRRKSNRMNGLRCSYSRYSSYDNILEQVAAPF
mmetsp:Transcript_3008/g.4712  ORF Transcript_3008/g.4712 Transcript_3008/m.4712 type:complete len:108 (+) Transcript_3008:828-1151(+)